MAVIERAASAGRPETAERHRVRTRLEAAILEARRHGLARTGYDLVLKAVNRLVPLKILRGVMIERPRAEFLECPRRFTPMFLSPGMLREFAGDPETRLSSEFVEAAIAAGDECFAILENGALAAYGWYASRPTRIDPPELRLRFSYDYVYMYNGYTLPRWRGQRLHAIGMTLALRDYLRRGRRGLVSYVESNNFDSLKSCRRMGYVEIGSIFVVRLAGRYRARSSRGCRRLGFRVEPAPETR
jgi:hypothetical protein